MNDTATELQSADVYDRHRGIHVKGSDLDAVSFPRYFEVLHSDRTIDADSRSRILGWIDRTLRDIGGY